MVGLPGFEPGSRDPQPRSIGQANLQAPIGLPASERSVKALTEGLLLSVDAEGGDLVDKVDVPHEHSSAAVQVETKVIEDFSGILALRESIPILLVLVGYDLPATPTSDRYQHLSTYLYDFCHFLRAPLPI